MEADIETHPVIEPPEAVISFLATMEECYQRAIGREGCCFEGNLEVTRIVMHMPINPNGSRTRAACAAIVRATVRVIAPGECIATEAVPCRIDKAIQCHIVGPRELERVLKFIAVVNGRDETIAKSSGNDSAQATVCGNPVGADTIGSNDCAQEDVCGIPVGGDTSGSSDCAQVAVGDSPVGGDASGSNDCVQAAVCGSSISYWHKWEQ